MEDPLAPAGADIESADKSFDIRFGGGPPARLVRGAHDDGVPADRRSRMDADFAAKWIDFLIVILLKIDGAVHAKARNPEAGPGVELDHSVSGCEVDDALVVSIRPIREAAAGEAARRNFGALAFVFAMRPQLFSRGG